VTKKDLIWTLTLTACLFFFNVTVTAHGTPRSTSVLPGIAQSTNQYLVEFKGNKLVPYDLSTRIAALGGTIVDTFPEIGVVLVAGLTDAAAAALASQSDVNDLTLDERVMPPDELQRQRRQLLSSGAPSVASAPESAIFYPFQWDKRAISADKAWRAGFLGSPDVRIAIIDSGIDPTHRDVGGLIDWTRSTSYCPGDDALVAQIFPGYPAWTDLNGHGTFVASVAASQANLTAGVTSRSTLMAVKALGHGCFGSAVLRGIAYSANHGADVINMSLAVGFFPFPKPGQKGYFHYYHLFTQYALVKGVSAVVVAAGNSSVDLDHDRSGFQGYCDVPGVICVSATGATDSGPNFLGPFLDVDAPAFYTNYGASAIDVAAPGGNASFDSAGNLLGLGFVWGACATTAGEFDQNGNFVLSECAGPGNWFAGSLGTSNASPQVAGLAALLVSQLGHGKSAQVQAAIETSADDLGKPGVDPFYGKGRINVARALGLD
jgi:subtilisin family serine protease